MTNCINLTSYIGKEISGEEFNKIYAGIDFVKLTNETECHNNFQFEDGLNIDKQSFNPSGECKLGGIYFVKKDLAFMWTYYGCTNGVMKYIRKINIPDDARVYVETDKFKTNKIILSPREKINREIYIAAVNHYHDLTYIPYDMRNKELCLDILRQIPSEFGKVPLELRDNEMCIDVVKRYNHALFHIPDELMNVQLCIIAVTHFPYALSCVPNKLMSKEICIEAIKSNYEALQYVPQSILDKEICLKAIELSLPSSSGLIRHIPQNLIDSDICHSVINKYGYNRKTLGDIPHFLRKEYSKYISLKPIYQL